MISNERAKFLLKNKTITFKKAEYQNTEHNTSDTRISVLNKSNIIKIMNW